MCKKFTIKIFNTFFLSVNIKREGSTLIKKREIATVNLNNIKELCKLGKNTLRLVILNIK